MLKILLIEDDQTLGSTIQLILSERSYSVRRSETFIEGLKAFLEEKPDIVLLDLGLPCTGIEEVIRGIKRFEGVPVIVLSARDDTLYAVQAYNQGAKGYIQKPVEIPQLIEQIESVYSSYKTKEILKESVDEMRSMKITFREMINGSGQ